uniref:Uncharacterized protein n=1 Tax=Meloidogyne javanica TaxID=6303 RepID=A0A915MF00_MELJA
AACEVVLFSPTSYDECLSAATAECSATGPVYPLCYAAVEAACAVVLAGPVAYPACQAAAAAACGATGPVFPVCYAAAQVACALEEEESFGDKSGEGFRKTERLAVLGECEVRRIIEPDPGEY